MCSLMSVYPPRIAAIAIFLCALLAGCGKSLPRKAAESGSGPVAADGCGG